MSEKVENPKSIEIIELMKRLDIIENKLDRVLTLVTKSVNRDDQVEKIIMAMMGQKTDNDIKNLIGIKMD